MAKTVSLTQMKAANDAYRKLEEERKARAMRNIAVVMNYGGDADVWLGDHISINCQPTGISGKYLRVSSDSKNRLTLNTTASEWSLEQAREYLKELRIAVKIIAKGQK